MEKKPEVKKLVIKVLDLDTNRTDWVHVCYLSQDLYTAFIEALGIGSDELVNYMIKWAYSDFRTYVTLSTKQELQTLKSLVMDKYKEINPTIFKTSLIDTKGWMRVWISEHIERELKWAK